MNKPDVITMMAQLADKGTKTDAEKYYNSFLGVLEHCAKNKEKLNLIGYLSMEISEVAERQGRNPKTKEPITIAKHNVVKLKGKSILKDLANS